MFLLSEVKQKAQQRLEQAGAANAAGAAAAMPAPGGGGKGKSKGKDKGKEQAPPERRDAALRQALLKRGILPNRVEARPHCCLGWTGVRPAQRQPAAEGRLDCCCPGHLRH